MTYDFYMLIIVHETKHKNVCVFVSPYLENDHYVHVGSKYLTKTNNGIVIVLII